jgi:hypothetical protein
LLELFNLLFDQGWPAGLGIQCGVNQGHLLTVTQLRISHNLSDRG